MTFRLTVNLDPVSIEFEAGSIGEAVAILTAEESKFAEIAGFGEKITEPAAETPDKPKRGRKPKVDPSTASAPPPAPIPAPAPAAAPLGAELPNGIPEGLARTAPQPVPTPQPVPPPAPPAVGELAAKVVANLNTRKAASMDAGAGLVAWLAQSGAVANGATYDEAIAVLSFMKDDQLKNVAQALGVV